MGILGPCNAFYSEQHLVCGLSMALLAADLRLGEYADASIYGSSCLPECTRYGPRL